MLDLFAFTPPGSSATGLTLTQNTNGQYTGAIFTGQNGSFISGSNFPSPLAIAGANIKSPEISGSTLTVPMSQYLTIQNANLAGSIQSTENANVRSALQNPIIGEAMLITPLGPLFNTGSKAVNTAIGKAVVSPWDPFYQSMQAGTLLSLGYPTQSINEFIQAQGTGFLYSTTIASAGTVTAGGGLAAVGAGSMRVVAARAFTGSAISIGFGEASSYANAGQPMNIKETVTAGVLGAATGIILGGEGASVTETAAGAIRTTASQVITKDVLPMAFFSGAIAFGVGWLNPSLWTGTSRASSTTTPTSQGLNNQGNPQSVSKSSSSWLSTIANTNYANPSFISFVGKSTLSGMTFGAEYGGAFEAIQGVAGAVLKEASPAAADVVKSKPIISRAALSGINAAAIGSVGEFICSHRDLNPSCRVESPASLAEFVVFF